VYNLGDELMSTPSLRAESVSPNPSLFYQRVTIRSPMLHGFSVERAPPIDLMSLPKQTFEWWAVPAPRRRL
jgi:hypothetical protein